MLSLRSFARSAPRAVSRLSAQTTRRPTGFLRNSVSIRAQCTPALRSVAAFHTTRPRYAAAEDSGVQEELVAKLENELALEQDAKDPEALSDHLQEFLDNSPFELQDTPGSQEVNLVRKFGDETIKVTFTIADLNAQNDPEDPDRALFDEEDPQDMIEDGQSGGANTKGAVNQGRQSDGNVRVAPEDSVAPADRPELNDESASMEDEESFPCRMTITITRPNKGALVVDAVTQDGETIIQDLSYMPTAELAEAKTPEKELDARALYTGPPFGNLDEELQILTDRYLRERGINEGMAMFIPEYIDFKEQREYVTWLENVKKFVE